MTQSSLESQIDELYRLPLAEFTSARNALAKTVKGADAKRIKQLAKPTVVPWTVNQLYWRARAVFDRLLTTGTALREAQLAALKGRSADVRRATEEHRAALAKAVKEAHALSTEAGTHPPVDQLARMLEALSLAPAAAVPPGRFTDVIRPSGFEALAGISPSDLTRPAAPTSKREHGQAATGSGPRLVTTAPVARQEDPAAARRREAEERRQAAEERQRAQQEAAARAKAAALVQTAERKLAHAREVLERAERAADEARHGVEEAERSLATARGDRVLSSPHV
jgi:hypothetical protein